MKSRKKYLLLFIIPLFAFNLHKYYLSLTQIEHKKNSLQIITNVFIDDIEEAINKEFNIDSRLNIENQPLNIDKYINGYFIKNLLIKVNNKSKQLNYLGKEYEGDLIYIYLEAEQTESIKNIEVINKILIKHFPKQQNLVKTKVGKEHRSVLLTLANDKGLLKY